MTNNGLDVDLNAIRNATSHEADLKTSGDRPIADYSSWHDGTSRYELTHDGKDYLSVFFASVIFANQKFIYSDILTELTFLHSILIVLTLAVVALYIL